MPHALVNTQHPAAVEHRTLLQAWTALVRDREKRFAQAEHDAMAMKWDRHREQHLESP